MKHLLLFVLWICYALSAFVQNQSHLNVKPILDSSMLGKFSLMTDPRISNDGRYICYTLNDRVARNNVLVVQSTETGWRKEFIKPASGVVFVNNRQLLFLVRDTLFFLSLGGEQLEHISGIASYKLSQPGEGAWLAYQLKGAAHELIVRNWQNGLEQRFNSVTGYAFDNKGQVLLLKTGNEANGSSALQWVNLQDNKVSAIWSGKADAVGGYNFDNEGRQLTFLVQSKKGEQPVYTLWYYRVGMDAATIKADDQAAGIVSNLFIGNTSPFFSANGQYIYFTLAALPDTRKPAPGAVKVTIWSYKDSVLQSLQQSDKKERSYLAVIAVNGSPVHRLEQEDEAMAGTGPGDSDFVVVENNRSISEYWWPSQRQQKRWLVSFKDGARKLFPCTRAALFFSPQGRHLVYYDAEKRQYFNYDETTGRVKNISGKIPVPLYDEEQVVGMPVKTPPNPYGAAGWLEDETVLLVYDKYDIWRLDPIGMRPPVNLTNGYGRRHHIRLRLLDKTGSSKGLSGETSVVLTAYNTLTKYSGYYRANLKGKGDPEQLTMEACAWGSMSSGRIAPLRARDADSWIVSRQTASEAPDYYFTKDFTHFKALTHLQPQEPYNWLTTELISWKRPDGHLNQGILYKPENFDPHKKYPVIFHYYDQSSDNLFIYMRPSFSRGRINIPWFVSHGYLVFTPDIYYTVGKTGQSVCMSVVSAAKYLSTLPFIDAQHMGLQGHSFGGYETNYLVAHTHIFAAAAEAAGTSNFVSSYGAIRGKPGQEGQINQVIEYEDGQYRTGTSLWQRPDIYIENSPLFKADQVTTPLLMMHNKGDANVPWSQGMEWYTGLRRLGKKVWMLEYEDGGHTVDDKDAVDYTIRLMQFFDHYLKGAPPPRWMTEGIPAKLRGIETGYELDTSGRRP